MEMDASSTVSESNQLKGLLLNIKVAIALAIIKNKPPGMSGREHAEMLASSLRRQDGGWKEEIQELQQEVLRLRQEKLMSRVMSNTAAAVSSGQQDWMHPLSQDLFDPAEPQLQPDSDPETPDLLFQDPRPKDLMLQDCRPHYGDPLGDALVPHMQFLQSLSALQRAEGTSRGLESLWFSLDGDMSSVFSDTAVQLLNSVVAACKAPLVLGPPDLVLQACRVTARALDLFCCQQLPSVEVRRQVEAPLRKLVQMLLDQHHPGGLETAEKLTDYLIVLGSSIIPESFLIRHILSEINTVADQLWQASQVQEGRGLDRFPVHQYQNCCHLLVVLEKLLKRSHICRPQVSTSMCTADLGSEQASFLNHLKRTLLPLSEEFPLFSIYLWRIGGLLTPGDR